MICINVKENQPLVAGRLVLGSTVTIGGLHWVPIFVRVQYRHRPEGRPRLP